MVPVVVPIEGGGGVRRFDAPGRVRPVCGGGVGSIVTPGPGVGDGSWVGMAVAFGPGVVGTGL